MRIVILLLALWYGPQIILVPILSAVQTRLDWEVMITFYDGTTPSGVRWNLAIFGIYVLILWAVMRGFHDLRLRRLLGPFARAIHDFGRVLLYLSPFYLLLMVPGLWDPALSQQYSVGRWLLILLPTLPLLFLQIGAEELVFRGYLQSHLASLVQSPLIWLGLPSVLFGLIHYDPTLPPDIAWNYVAWTTLFGLICADLTARSGTLGPALALHFVNNLTAVLVMASNDWLYGASLFVLDTGGVPFVPWWPQELIVMLILWLAARLALQR